jgi:transcriptional regulator with XRE-family HTH domain
MSAEKDEVRRLLDILHTFMRMLVISNREVERRLGLKNATISRLLSGHIEAKVDLVLAVARAIGLEYEEFFAFAYPERSAPKPESASARKLRSMLEDLRPPRGQSRPEEAAVAPQGRVELFEDVKRAVREIMEEMAAENAARPKAGNGGR